MSSIQYRSRLCIGTLCGDLLATFSDALSLSSRFGNHHNTALDEPCALQKSRRLSCTRVCCGRRRPFNFVANISELLLVVNVTRRNDTLTTPT
jgi:hypothetical protein